MSETRILNRLVASFRGANTGKTVRGPVRITSVGFLRWEKQASLFHAEVFPNRNEAILAWLLRLGGAVMLAALGAVRDAAALGRFGRAVGGRAQCGSPLVYRTAVFPVHTRCCVMHG